MSAWGILMSAAITATVSTVDFGVIRESEGPKKVRLYVRNDSTAPVALLKVNTTCGCTAASFMKEEIAPGDSAWIDLTYNPYRRPGRFEKAVKVFPTQGEMIRIPIEGVVYASEETIEHMFPYGEGPLRLSANTLMPARPLTTEQKTLFLDVYNTGDRTVYPRMVTDSDAITTMNFPDSVPPGEKGMIGLYVDPKREERTGPIEYTLLLYTSPTPDFKEEGEATPATITIKCRKEQP